MAQKIKAVLDTNVFVSGLINPSGAPGYILKALKESRFTLVTSPAINQEILEVLNRPILRDRYHLTEHFFDIAFLITEIAEVVVDIPMIKASKDPDDNKFLATAFAGKAEYLVTGDIKDLLELREYKSVHIVTPQQFITILSK